MGKNSRSRSANVPSKVSQSERKESCTRSRSSPKHIIENTVQDVNPDKLLVEGLTAEVEYLRETSPTLQWQIDPLVLALLQAGGMRATALTRVFPSGAD